MRIGITQIVDGRPGKGLDYIQASAQAMESRGFASYWTGDHIVFFSEYSDTYPHSDTGKFGFRDDQGLFEPLMALQAAAMATTSLRVGIGVEVVPERNPVVRARDIATLDQFSNGRFLYGVGVGWSSDEAAAVGVPWERRGARTDDYLRAMKALWTETPASYHGEFVNFDNVIANPKPVQKPHPPILVGGNTPAAMRRLASLGDGWLGWKLKIDELDGCLELMDAALAKEGRERDSAQLLIGMPHTGGLDELVDYLTEVEKRGIEEFVIGLALSQNSFEKQLDDYASALSKWML